MSFYLISSKHHEDKLTRTILREACERKGISLEILDVTTLDPLDLPTLTASDILYRASTSTKARMVEKLLLSRECTHIYDDLFSALSSHGGSIFHHRQHGSPTIPTVPFIPDSRAGVALAVDRLDGLPLVVKVIGGSLGVGVIKTDTLDSLNSLLDYLRDKHLRVYLRKYIEHEYYIRAVVLGDAVIASHATYPAAGEFRTNVEGMGDQRREAIALSPELCAIAAMATKALHVDFAGVDILIGKDKTAYIAEVNAPFDFVCTQKVTGVDIAERLVTFLMEKSQRGS